MDLAHLEDLFVDIGGEFRSSAFDIREKLENNRAFVWDWDGVYNNGRQTLGNSSNFSEVDGLGTSMLRFGHFLKHKSLPATAIITGTSNDLAIEFAVREGFDAVYVGVKDKQQALDHLTEQHSLSAEQLTYFFDDVLDIPIAQKVGIRFAVHRNCNPLFNKYLHDHNLVDYISGNSGEEHAVREFAELLLCLMEQFEKTLEHRVGYDDFFKDFIQKSKKVQTRIFQFENEKLVEKSPEDFLK